ncbi:MAG: radical SAM protein [Spirochaetes bacterium]|nr:radical SAM protein [Spirochaetota bacterium]
MKKRVLLINPPYPLEESPSPPFGLMSLAAYLIQNGADVLIEDYIVNPYSRGRIKRIIGDFKPDMIGATAVTMNVKGALAILGECREESPGSLIVMGGPHVSFDAQEILAENLFLDAIVRGEGEMTTVELLGNLENREAFSRIRGLSYRDGAEIAHNEKRDFIQDINVLPYPARHLVQLSKYKALGFPLNMITSRGCPYECIFCVGSKMVGRRVRYYDIQRVADEFEMLSKQGFRQINIVDDLFTSNKRRCIQICEEIMRRGIRHDWTAFARVDTVNRELLEVMKAAGCTMLCFGIESGVQEILDRIKKKITLEKIEKAIRLCSEVGVVPMASYIMGLPGETPETVRQTMEFARAQCRSYGFHILAPFPGTEVREKAADYGMRILTSDWDKYDANRSVCESIHLPHQDVDRIVGEFNEGINRMILCELEKHEHGETLTPVNQEMVNNIISIDFNNRLIREELVERYALANNDGGGVENFVNYVTENSGLRKDVVSGEVERLFRLGCLTSRNEGAVEEIAWS